MDVKDSNGAVLKDGDNVILIKDLKVKGTSATLKRGTLVKGIRLTDDPDEVECRVEKNQGPGAAYRVSEEGVMRPGRSPTLACGGTAGASRSPE